MVRIDKRIGHTIFFASLGALFYLPFLGGVHLFDWDEINFAEISREMLLTGNFSRVQIDFFPFYEKPPLFFWLQAFCMKIFGVGEFSARLPNAICGIITLPILYNIGSRLYDHRFGVIWTLAYFGSFLPFFYYKSGIIDPVFNLFIFLGVLYFIRTEQTSWGNQTEKKKQWSFLILSGIFIGLATLTKGPVAILILFLLVVSYSTVKRRLPGLSFFQMLTFVAVIFIVTAIWFGYEASVNGPEFSLEFVKYQWRLLTTPDAGHGGFPGYHFVVVLVGCFPASVFAIRSFMKPPPGDSDSQVDFRLWMKCLFWIVLILFSIVESKIVHYSSLCYFPLTFLAATVIYHIVEEKMKLKKWMLILLWTIGFLYVLATFVMPYLAWNIDSFRLQIDQESFLSSALAADVNWSGWEVLPGIALFMMLLFFTMSAKRLTTYIRFVSLFIAGAIVVFMLITFYIKRIEGYTQRAAIEFIQEKSKEGAYVLNVGYKSYAHLYYSKRSSAYNSNLDSRDENANWLLWGDVDRPLYFISRVDKLDQVRKWIELEEIGRKNGYVFLKRR